MGLFSTPTPNYVTSSEEGGSVNAGRVRLSAAQKAAILALETGITDAGKLLLLREGGFTTAEAILAYEAGDVSGAVLAYVGVTAPAGGSTKKHIISSPAWAVNVTPAADDILATAGASFTVHVPKGRKVRVRPFAPRWTSTTLAANPWPSVEVTAVPSSVVVNSDDSEEWTFLTVWKRWTGAALGGAPTLYTAAAAGAYDVTIESEIY